MRGKRHGLRINVREKQWREIKGMTPTEAADRAASDHHALSPAICGTKEALSICIR